MEGAINVSPKENATRMVVMCSGFGRSWDLVTVGQRRAASVCMHALPGWEGNNALCAMK